MTANENTSKGIPQDLLDNILKSPNLPQFKAPGKKNKILWLSDHPLSTSGVGTQSRFLIEGLLATGKYSFQCLGGAIRHENYNLIQVKPDWVIKPVDGFGTRQMIRELLLTERPDAVFLFTDPRQFIWLWEMADEIQQVCPIVYWHVWDNGPYPEYNKPWYESTDLINCISWKTYELVKERFPEKTNYIPHALPKQVYHKLPDEQIRAFKAGNFGTRRDHFTALWVNRNATRKMPNDVLSGWKLFLDKLEQTRGHRNALLVMHTEPTDPEGPNLLAVTEQLGIWDNVWFSNQAQPFESMNMLHNACDTVINMAKAEGFGLSSLTNLTIGKPVISLCTGGLTRQVIDWRDGTENGVALPVRVKSLVGSQVTPYIYEDFGSHEDLANALMRLYEMSPQDRENLSRKCQAYAEFEFNYDKVVADWDRTLSGTIETYKKEKKPSRWTCQKVAKLRIASGPGGPPQHAGPPNLASPIPSHAPANLPDTAQGDVRGLLRAGMKIRTKVAQ